MVNLSDERILWYVAQERIRREAERMQDMIKGMSDYELMEFENKMKEKVLNQKESIFK